MSKLSHSNPNLDDVLHEGNKHQALGTQTTPDLLPCPFCGSHAQWAEFDRRDGNVFAIECSNQEGCPIGCCMEMDTWSKTYEEAVKRWNTRQ